MACCCVVVILMRCLVLTLNRGSSLEMLLLYIAFRIEVDNGLVKSGQLLLSRVGWTLRHESAFCSLTLQHSNTACFGCSFIYRMILFIGL